MAGIQQFEASHSLGNTQHLKMQLTLSSLFSLFESRSNFV